MRKTIVEKLREYLDNTPEEKVKSDWESSVNCDEVNGPTVEEFINSFSKISEDIVYHIIHPRGDKSKISVLEYSLLAHDLCDFVLASGKNYENPKLAIQHAVRIGFIKDLEYVNFKSRYTNLTEEQIIRG